MKGDYHNPLGIDFNDYWVRIDCDNPIGYRDGYLHAFMNKISLTRNVKIPFLHNQPVWESKKFLSQYTIPRIWFFRPYTVPNDSWNEPFGLHATYKEPWRFYRELNIVEDKLGAVTVFTRHGFAPIKSGTLWTPEECLRIEEIFGLTDLTTVYHHTLDRGVEYEGQKCILLHPSALKQSITEFQGIMEEIGY